MSSVALLATRNRLLVRLFRTKPLLASLKLIISPLKPSYGLWVGFKFFTIQQLYLAPITMSYSCKFELTLEKYVGIGRYVLFRLIVLQFSYFSCGLRLFTTFRHVATIANHIQKWHTYTLAQYPAIKNSWYHALETVQHGNKRPKHVPTFSQWDFERMHRSMLDVPYIYVLSSFTYDTSI